MTEVKNDIKDKITNVKDAEFEEVTEDHNMAIQPYSLWRHPLMKGISTEKVKDTITELEIDKALGFQKQAEMTKKELLSDDIDRVTKKHGYPEITGDLLRKLFSFDKIKEEIEKKNFKENLNAIMPLIYGIASSLITVFFMIIFAMNPSTMKFSVMLSSFIGTAFLIYKNRMPYNKTHYYVNFDISDVKYTKIKLPLGVKKAILKAYEEKVFNSFSIASIVHDERNVDKDPAILGVALDGRQFMICWWDTKENMPKDLPSLEIFKKFKIEV